MSKVEQIEGFHAAAFTRADDAPDAEFYAERMPDTLMDLGARTAVTALYQTALPVGGRVLDVMAGSLSHYPEEAKFADAIGLGVTQKALDANPVFTTRIVQDLNENPILPFEDQSLDAVTLCDGVAYLTQPFTVFQELYRVLKPGAPVIVTFGDAFHAQKACALWHALESEDRSRLVSILLSRAGFVDLDTGEVVPPEDLNGWHDTVRALIGRRARD